MSAFGQSLMHEKGSTIGHGFSHPCLEFFYNVCPPFSHQLRWVRALVAAIPVWYQICFGSGHGLPLLFPAFLLSSRSKTGPGFHAFQTVLDEAPPKAAEHR